jgi:hypothetical protein
VKTYLSFYSPRFKPEQGSLAAWTKQRTQRIEKASNITVEVDKLNVRASPRAPPRPSSSSATARSAPATS